MKKLIYILFTIFIITNQNMAVQAGGYPVNANISQFDSNYVDLGFDDEIENMNYSFHINITMIVIIFIIAYIIQGCIFGIATQKIIENKGYSENWFWWGFFFGLIAMLIALSKPELHKPASSYNILHNLSDSRIMEEGGWECAFCHRRNNKIVTTCLCGKGKAETEKKIKQKEQLAKQQFSRNHVELDTIELLEKYKKLLDSGTITQEEFETKKKQLLEK